MNAIMAKWVVSIAFVVGIATAVKIIYERCGPARTPEEYLRLRQDFMTRESFERVGGKLILNHKEEAVNRRLLELKHHEINYYKNNKNGKGFPPSLHFFQAKEAIENSEVYRIIKRMPKGAALHLHEMALTNIDWIIRHFTYNPFCYMCIAQGRVKLAFYEDETIGTECSWKQVNELRLESGDATQFDARLRENITLMTTKPGVHDSQGELWEQFEACFQALMGIFFSDTGFKEYVRHGLEEMYDDNVQYVELRSIYSNVSRLDGTSLPETWMLEAYRDISQSMQKEHADFMGMKIIIAELRRRAPSLTGAKLGEILAWTERYPRLIVGYDMVSQEDAGFPLVQYVESLLSVHKHDLPFMFHSGESKWIGMEVDNNLIDAVLLNTTRIGHGYAIAHHPQVLQAVYRNKIAIEINPISNQVLGLVSDLRNHPGAMLMSMGFPVVISADDLSLWGAQGLSHDFYLALMGFTGGWGDLATLKELAINSIIYSGLLPSEKDELMAMWLHKWELFLDDVLDMYTLSY